MGSFFNTCVSNQNSAAHPECTLYFAHLEFNLPSFPTPLHFSVRHINSLLRLAWSSELKCKPSYLHSTNKTSGRSTSQRGSCHHSSHSSRLLPRAKRRTSYCSLDSSVAAHLLLFLISYLIRKSDMILSSLIACTVGLNMLLQLFGCDAFFNYWWHPAVVYLDFECALLLSPFGQNHLSNECKETESIWMQLRLSVTVCRILKTAWSDISLGSNCCVVMYFLVKQLQTGCRGGT